MIGHLVIQDTFVARLSRLEPPYVLALIVRLALIVLVFRDDLLQLLPHFLASLFYVHNIVFGTMSRVSPPTWSLEVEVQYYLLAPVFARVFLIRRPALRRMLMLGVIVGLSISTQWTRVGEPRFAMSLLGNLQFFTAGLLLCDFFLTGALQAIPRWLWDLAALTIALPLIACRFAWIDAVLPVASLGLFLGGLRGGLVRRFFASRPISVAGGMCYSVYLTHGTVLAAVAMVLKANRAATYLAGSAVAIGLSLLATFAAGAVYFACLERPCMDPSWPHRLTVALARWRALVVALPLARK